MGSRDRIKPARGMMDTAGLIADLSWRNVWRNGRRTLLTFLTIMAGCMMVIFMRSMQNGAFEQMAEDGISLLTGHIQIHESGYWKNRTMEYAFRDDPALLGSIRSMKHVKAVSRRIHAGALIIYGESAEPVEIIGIEPSVERDISTIGRCILPGGMFLRDEDTKSVVIGEVIAKKLGVKTGGTVSILSQGFDGSIAADYLRVSGIFSSQNTGYNSSMAFMSFRQTVETFSMSGYVSSYTVRLDSNDALVQVAESIRTAAGDGLEVMSWEDLMPEIMQFIVIKRFGSYLYVVILYLIVAFGILNTIQMSVYERIRELGIMTAIGTGPGRIFSMIMTESVIVALLGICAGLAGGAALSYYFTVNPVDISGYRSEMGLYNVTTLVYHAKMKTGDFVECIISLLFIAVVFTYFPAKRASGLDPVRAIRHL